MNNSGSLFVDNIVTLQLVVTTIGYKKRGESQVIILIDKESKQVILSFIIDCYSKKSLNITEKVLNDYGVCELDYFIWTHTDEDHSIGIDDIIDKFCNQNTNFFLPEGVTGNETDFINYNKAIKKTFRKINSFNSGKNYTVHTVTTIDGCYQPLVEKTIIDKNTSRKIVFKVIGIAPLSSIVRRKLEKGEVRRKNEISIATIFQVGELTLFFGGDIENQTINRIPNHFFKELDFIKIPHHTSTSANKLISKLEDGYTNKISSSVTTTYKRHNLPNLELVDEYKKYVDLFHSTGTGKKGFGYVKTTFDIIKKEIHEDFFGDASTL